MEADAVNSNERKAVLGFTACDISENEHMNLAQSAQIQTVTFFTWGTAGGIEPLEFLPGPL